MTQEDMTEIYDTHRYTIYRTAFAWCKNRTDAEDVMQEVFLKYFSGAKRMQDADVEKAWLLRMTINKCKDLFKSAHRRHTVPLEEAACICQTPQEDEVYHAVMELPPDYRMAVHLYYYEGYSIREIAGIMRKTESAAAAVLSRARKRLKQLLGEEMEL